MRQHRPPCFLSPRIIPTTSYVGALVAGQIIAREKSHAVVYGAQPVCAGLLRTHTYTANSLMTVVLPRVVSLDGLGLVTLAVYLIVVGGWCIR